MRLCCRTPSPAYADAVEPVCAAYGLRRGDQLKISISEALGPVLQGSAEKKGPRQPPKLPKLSAPMINPKPGDCWWKGRRAAEPVAVEQDANIGGRFGMRSFWVWGRGFRLLGRRVF